MIHYFIATAVLIMHMFTNPVSPATDLNCGLVAEKYPVYILQHLDDKALVTDLQQLQAIATASIKQIPCPDSGLPALDEASDQVPGWVPWLVVGFFASIVFGISIALVVVGGIALFARHKIKAILNGPHPAEKEVERLKKQLKFQREEQISIVAQAIRGIIMAGPGKNDEVVEWDWFERWKIKDVFFPEVEYDIYYSALNYLVERKCVVIPQADEPAPAVVAAAV